MNKLSRRILVLTTILFSFVILFVSITQTAQVKYSFNEALSGQTAEIADSQIIEYYFPYPGRILPDHPLWTFKAMRDRVWLSITPSAARRAELNLLLANKRLISAKILFERDKSELAFSVLTKASKYLESALKEEETARARGVDTKSFLISLARASLKHREIVREIYDVAAADVKPEISKIEEKTDFIYMDLENVFRDENMTAPDNPFRN